jgi:hypothetical protein
VGGVGGRRCELVPGDTQVASMAHWSGRKMVVFREARGEMVGGASVLVRDSAGRGWGDVEGSMPYRLGCGAGLGGVQVHGNTRLTPDALDGSAA